MCGECGAPPWSRRRVLAATGAVAAGLALPVRPVSASVSVLPRSAWAGDQVPAGAIADEPDVRFLLVHHTVDRNDYPPDAVAGLLRQIHRFHTGPERGWPDIAYNFIVDRFGRVWETRAGSLDRPVAGDATGGNQGFDQKCAFLGDHRTEAPTREAVAAMADLLAFLADRSGVDTSPGARTSFESRGSNRHPAGTRVETATITGHREMSRTSCPGDAGHAVVRDWLPAEVTARRRSAPPFQGAPVADTTTTTSAATPAPSSVPAAGERPAAAPANTSSTSTTPSSSAPPSTPAETTAPSTVPSIAEPTAEHAVEGGRRRDDRPPDWPVLGAAGGVGAVLLGGLLALRSRRMR